MSLIYTAATSGGARRNSVYIGGRSDAKSLEKLERWNISRILNVTPAKETSIQAGVPNFYEKTKRFVYKRIPVYDAATSAAQLEAQAEEIVSFISSGLFHGSVLVHCQHGVSRSTTCVVMYLIRKAEMSLKDAMGLVQRRRPEAQPIPAFVQLLERYEKTCRRIIESSSTGSERPNKKAKMTPSVGPSRGPQGPPVSRPASAAIGPSIGPSPPPAAFTERKRDIGPVAPSSIGPSLPNHDAPNRNSERDFVRPPNQSIGPSLPPAPTTSGDSSAETADAPRCCEDNLPLQPSTGLLARTSSGSSNSEKRVIGPSFPPPKSPAE